MEKICSDSLFYSDTLDSLNPGASGIIKALRTSGSMRRRFQDIGLIKGTIVHCVGVSPFGDPSAYMIRGAVIAIRRSDCQDIYVDRLDTNQLDADRLDQPGVCQATYETYAPGSGIFKDKK